MSMPKIEKSENPIDREQSINNLIESVALMETGLSHVINAEGEKIQKVIKHGEDIDVPIEDILKVNESSEKMINTISKLEMILQSKLEASKELDASNVTPCPKEPFLSSYFEALGETQDIYSDANVVFNTIDKVGKAIELNSAGTIFTINQAGLYLVEWSLNLAADNTNKSEFNLLQNGIDTSSAANSALIGNFSSGALINVANVPYTISLHNHGDVSNRIEGFVNTNSAASIRILRFADGPSK